MTLKALLHWQNPDSTSDINNTQAQIIDRTIFSGGQVTLSGSSLSLTVAPFVATGFDGMVSTNDTVFPISIPPNSSGGPLVYYIICYAKYLLFTAPIQVLQILDATTYTSHVDHNYFITFGKLTVPNGASTGSACTLDLSASDLSSGLLGKGPIRGVVANAAALPAGTAVAPLRPGDTYISIADHTIYMWNGSVFQSTGNTTLTQTMLANSQFVQDELRRNQMRSGLISTQIGNYALSFDETDTSPFIATNTVANQIGLRAMKLAINGHIIETPATTITLAAPPGTPGVFRYDLIYIEAWRVQVDPTTVTYQTYPQPATLTAPQIEDLATLATATTPNSGLVANTNYESNYIQVSRRDPTKFVQVRYRIGFMTDTGNNRTWLTNYPFGAAPNVGAIPAPFFSGAPYTQPALESGDPNIFVSFPASGADDNVSWMIPILLVKRTASESGPSNYIQKIRTDDNKNRYVFEIFPVNEVTKTLEKSLIIDPAYASTTRTADNKKTVSGFLDNVDPVNSPITGIGSNQIQVPSGNLQIAGEIIPKQISPFSVTLATGSLAGSTSADSWRDLVYMRIIRTPFPNTLTTFNVSQHVLTSINNNTAHLAVYSQIDFVAVRTQVAFTSVEDYMTTIAGLTQSTTDPGLWSGVMSGTDDRPTIDSGNFFAIPIAIVQRRNTGSYSNTNQNGSVNRPDGHTDVNTSYPEEILDCRSKVVRDPYELDKILNETMELAIRGKLKTNFQVHPFAGALIYGTSHLIYSRASFGVLANTELIGLTDGVKTSFSAADEYQVVSFRLPATTTTSTGLVRWNPTLTHPTLQIQAPFGAYLMVAGPEFITNEIRPRYATAPWINYAANAGINYVFNPAHGEEPSDVYNPVSLGISRFTGTPTANQLYPYTGLNNPNIMPFEPCVSSGLNHGQWLITANDGSFDNNPTTMLKPDPGGPLGILADWDYPIGGPSPSEILISYWVKYPHPKAADATHAFNYANNIGMFAEPETVWSASLTIGASTQQVAVGIPVSEVLVTSTGTSTYNITQGELLAGLPAIYGTINTVLLFAVEYVSADTIGLQQVTSVLIAGNQQSGTITTATTTPIGTTVRIKCYVQPVGSNPSDWTQFIIINPVNRTVKGMFRFATQTNLHLQSSSNNINRIVVAPDASTNAVYVPWGYVGAAPVLGVPTYHDITGTPAPTLRFAPAISTGLAGSGNTSASKTQVILMYRIFGSGSSYAVTSSDPSPSVFGTGVTSYSCQNIMSGIIDVTFNNTLAPPGASPANDLEIALFGIACVPIPSNGTLTFYYTAGAYQGTVIGAVADPSTNPAVQALKNKIHGRLEALTNVYTSTAGSGISSYPLAAGSITDNVGFGASGSMDAPIPDVALPWRGITAPLPSFLYQKLAITNGVQLIRPDRNLVSVGNIAIPLMLTNIMQRLPFSGRSISGFDDSSFSYQEILDVAKGSINAALGDAMVVLRDVRNGRQKDAATPAYLGAMYQYPSAWTSPEIAALEKALWWADGFSRGISLGIATTVGEMIAIFMANSWLVPFPAPTQSLASFEYLTGSFPLNMVAESLHVESSPIGIYQTLVLTSPSQPGGVFTGGVYFQFFGALVNPSSAEYGGRLHMMVGTNPNGQSTSFNGTPQAAGGTFDAFIPIGRPLIQKIE